FTKNMIFIIKISVVPEVPRLFSYWGFVPASFAYDVRNNGNVQQRKDPPDLIISEKGTSMI
ncbi:hypothetical protein J2Z64_004140, partial [Oceanobacillus polygoni]|nr:hypothetical protein [Oceanobacillus polygoni]